MWFWLTILGGLCIAALAVKIGFFETFAASFNVVLAVYAALFFTPFVLTLAPQAADIPNGLAITSLVIGIGVFLILFAVCFFLITGQFTVSFPKLFDVVFAGTLGFLIGFLVLSFALVTVCRATSVGRSQWISAEAITPNTDYLCWWCDHVHGWIGSKDWPTDRPTQEVLTWFTELAQPKAAPKASEKDPNTPLPKTTPSGDYTIGHCPPMQGE